MKKITYYNITSFTKKMFAVDLSDCYSSNFENMNDAMEAFEMLKNDILESSIIDIIELIENYDDDTGVIIKRFDKNNYSISFGELLKEKRASLFLRQIDVAEKIGVPLYTYQRWEYNIHIPSANFLIKLQSVLDLSSEEIKDLL